MLGNIIKYMRSLSREPQKTISLNETVMYGDIIGITDVIASIYHHSVSSMSVYGNVSIIFDSNIKAPGVSFSFSAFIWNVIDKKTIDLKGKESKSHMEQASVGCDGMPGNPGGMGGNVYGIYGDIINSNKLTFDTSGSDGANGQRGGNGKNGSSSTSGCKDEVLNKSCSYKIKKEDKSFMCNEEDEYYTYTSGTKAEAGGHSGAGGMRGKGGRSGKVLILNSSMEVDSMNINIIKRPGKDGQDGMPGIPGKGGTNIGVYSGVFVKKHRPQYALPAGGLTLGALGGVIAGATVNGLTGGVVGGIFFILPVIYDRYDNNYWKEYPKEIVGNTPDGSTPKYINMVGVKKSPSSDAINSENVISNSTWLRELSIPYTKKGSVANF